MDRGINKRLKKLSGTRVRHLYIHLPFCSRRCHYCDFYSETGKEELAPLYIKSLLAEAESYGEALECVETLYLGGGTPSLLGPKMLEELLGGIGSRMAPGAEVSVEANPGSLDAAMAGAMSSANVSRVSLGVQSFSRRLRRNLGRFEGDDVVGESIALLKREGFKNISVDLIFAIPEQDTVDLKRDIQQALTLAPEHISYYELSVKEGGPLALRWPMKLEEMQQRGGDFYRLVVDGLQEGGYRWYETSNFALPGYECKHNLSYWAGKDYIGLGAGAWSTVGNLRWRNVENIGLYLESEAAVESMRYVEELSPSQKAAEQLFLGLRREDGVSREPLKEILNHAAETCLIDNGFLANEGGKIKLTRPGRMMANDICARLLR